LPLPKTQHKKAKTYREAIGLSVFIHTKAQICKIAERWQM